MNKWKQWFQSTQYNPNEYEYRILRGMNLLEFHYELWESIIDLNVVKDSYNSTIKSFYLKIALKENELKTKERTP